MWGSGDVNSDYCGLDGCDFLVVHTTGNNSGVNDCPARAFNANSNDGSLQITTGSAFLTTTVAGPRVNGPVQHVAPGRSFYIDAGAAAFYAQNNAPTEGDPYFTDDRGLQWISDEPYQYATDGSVGFSSGFDHQVDGDIYNLAFMYESVATGDYQYKINVTSLNTYVVSLYLMEVYWTAPKKRLFNILINGDAVFQSVDIYALSGGENTALQLHCFVNLTSATSIPIITIVSQGITDNPILSGFTILSYTDFVATFPGEAIDPGTAANAPPIAGVPNAGGGGGGGGAAPPPPTPPSLAVPAGWVWISPANTTYVTGGQVSTASSSITVNQNSPDGVPLNSWESAQPQLFLTNRYGSMTYSIPAPSAGAWQLRLLFAETYWSTLGSRVFDVTVNGATVLSNLDLNAVGPVATTPATTGASSNLISTTAFVYAETLQLTAGQLVTINFIADHDNPLVCGVLLVPVSSSSPPVSSTAARVVSSTAAVVATSAPTVRSSTAAVARSSSSSSAAAVAHSSTAAVAHSSTAAATAAPVKAPTFSLLIDVGSSSSYTQDATHVWQADEYYNVAGLTWAGQSNQVYANTASSLYAVYNSNRYSAGVVNYTLPVTAAGSYLLRLLFAEIYWTTAGARQFDVEVQGVVIVPQLDLYVAAGGAFTAYDVYTNVTLTGQQRSVQVVLRTIKDNALLSGIQLQSNF